MKLIDRYDPKLSEANQRLSAKNLISTYTTERKIPYIEMRLLGDQVIATVSGTPISTTKFLRVLDIIMSL